MEYPFFKYYQPTFYYLWSNGDTAANISGIAPGNFMVTVTDANECTQTGNWAVGHTLAVCANISVADNVITTVCYNATNNITVAGGSGDFIVSPNGDATFIAGVSINFLPGTTVQPGGKMHGYISTGTYCGGKAATIADAATGQDERPASAEFSSFTLFPNPTTGNFVLVQKGDNLYGDLNVEIYNMRGEKVLKAGMIGEKRHEFSMPGLPEGLYFVKIVADDHAETIKLVKTR
ncbi:MAG: T9SS type A sorting domain-containing protein [Bacteroidota bacterium]